MTPRGQVFFVTIGPGGWAGPVTSGATEPEVARLRLAEYFPLSFPAVAPSAMTH